MYADERIVVLPNGTLANTTIVNNTTTPNRRADLIVSVAYDTNLDLAKKVALEVLNNADFVLKDKDIMVYVSALGASSVDLGVRYYTKNDNFLVSKGVILESIKVAFDQNNIEIPYQQLDVRMR